MKKPRTLAAEELFQYALSLLGGRAMAAAEVRSRLLRRAANPGDVDSVIGRLREYGCIDDDRFAEGFAAARRDSGAFGPARVRRDLRQRLVSPSVADRAVSGAFHDADETAMVAQWLQRKYRNVDLPRYLRDPRNLTSAWRKLRYAGFSSASAVQVLRRYSDLAGELQDEDSELAP